MASTLLTGLRSWEKDPVLSRLRPKGLPILFGEENLEMGESSRHTRTCDILLYGVASHLQRQPEYRVFCNLNLQYSEEEPGAYASPDLMVVRPARPLPEDVSSYRSGAEGPAPLLVGEVLSFRTYQQGDLTSKPILYASLAIEEYILVDVSGELLEQKLLLLRLTKGTWSDEQDADGGITSRLGFRVVLESDGQVRVLDAQTGKRYARPDEAQAAVDEWASETRARRKVEARLRTLEKELARLRGKGRKRKGP